MDEGVSADPDLISAPSTVTVMGAKGRREIDPKKTPIERCDFRSPALVSEADLRRLRMQQNDFARQFGARVSSFLRLECNLTLVGVATTPFSRFTQGLPDPAHLSLFKLEPLPGLGIISLPPTLGLAVTNRMLGGRGPGEGGRTADRALTEIETSLLEDFVRMLAEEWCRHWPEGREASPLIVGYETSGKFLQTAPDNATMLTVTFDISLGELPLQTVQIAMPFAALEGSIRRGGSGTTPRKGRMNSPLPDKAMLARHAVTAAVPLPVIAQWKVAHVTLRDIMQLRPSDVLELPADTLAKTSINLTGRQLFVGTAGLRDGRVAVRLDRRLENPAAGQKDLISSLLA